MKRTSLTFCLLIAFITALSLPEANAQFGIRGSMNIANIYNSDIDTESRVGLAAGIFTSLKVPATPLTIQPEVLYSQKGAKQTGTINGTEYTLTTKLDYIEVPVLAKFNFIGTSPVSPNVYFGPYLGFNINAEAEYENGGGSLGGDISDSVKGTDFGLVVGAGIDVSKFMVGVRYSAGLTKINDDSNADDSKNSVIAITAGIKL